MKKKIISFGRMTKCLLSWLLTLTLILGFLSSFDNTSAKAAVGNTGTETALRNAVSASGDGDVILSTDIGTLTTQLTIARSLILDLNGYSLTIDLPEITGRVSNGIKLNPGVTLTISDSVGTGILNVINRGDILSTGNGAAINTTDGALIIQSGTIIANGGGSIIIDNFHVFNYGGAGIGGGHGVAGGNITINGGAVYATSPFHGAGIGGGLGGSSGIITINGGSIEAIGGKGNEFSSGVASNSGAGIGGGGNGSCDVISINGGAVKATGGNDGAGIGGGYNGDGGIITISGGTIEAIGGINSPALGRGGDRSKNDTIRITGTYDYWVNNTNTAPAEQTGTGTFVYRGHRYIKLVPSGNVGTEETLRDEVAEGGSDDVILSANIGTLTTQLTIARSLTLDLNGHELVIVLDGITGSFNNGITLNPGVTLTIIDSIGGGKLEVENTTQMSLQSGGGAAINITDGTLIIQSGTINATGTSAGIGGGCEQASGTITISGGTVNATGGQYASGIGGSNGRSSGTITINGGTVNATGGSGGAGIGGGGHMSNYYGASGNITITGGVVTAKGGDNGAGIGGGRNGDYGIIEIFGGFITSAGGWGGAGIGSGYCGKDGTITITDGIISASGGEYGAGIGGGYYSEGGAVTISNGTATAIAGVGNESQMAIGTGHSGGSVSVNILGKYNYWVNTINNAPVDKSGTGVFSNSSTYKYVKLEPFVDKTELKSAIETFEFLVPSNWTEDSWAIVQKAFNTALVVYNTVAATQDDVDNVVQALTVAIVNLIENPPPVLVTVNSEATLRSEVSENGSGDVVLGANIGTLTTQLTIARSLTLDLNGHTLTINLSDGNNNNGIKLNPDIALTIMDSVGGGILNVSTWASFLITTGCGAAINTTDGTLIIQSGTVTATGGYCASGIGGGFDGNGGNIIINGGTVNATGGYNGAGIGGGQYGNGGNITITSGNVNASGDAGGAGIGGGNRGNGESITIAGGITTAIGGWDGGAGIGGGCSSSSYEGNSGDIIITGGIIEAKSEPSSSATAIGSGAGRYTATVNVTGTYDYWVNTTNTPPAEKTGRGIFTYTYSSTNKYIKLSRYVSSYDLLLTNAATSIGDSVFKLTQDITGDERGTMQLMIARSLTLDLNGHVMAIALSDEIGRNSNGIKLNPGVTLTIIDSVGSGMLDVSNASLISTNGNGAAFNITDGTLIIEGGAVTATGGSSGAGIGGGANNTGGIIIINGGYITAKGGSSGAGIGGGEFGIDGGNITINDGEVTAISGGWGGAAFGGGSGGAGGSITINGGKISATGGSGGVHSGAGIGGGSGGSGGYITISGGEINVTGGGNSAGIGGGVSGSSGTIIISGGTIETIGGAGTTSGAGIGGGDNGNGGNIQLTGGEIIAKGGNQAAGIGGGSHGLSGNIDIQGGMITAISGYYNNSLESNPAAIGRGQGAWNETIIITGMYNYWVNAESTTPEEKTGTGVFPYNSAYRYIRLAPPTCLVTVINGSGGGEYTEGDVVTLFADAAPIGKVFKEWEITPSVFFVEGTNQNNQTVKFIMPPEGVIAEAKFETRTVTSISITTQPINLTYFEGQLLDLAGLVITVTYVSGSPESIAFVDFVDAGVTTNPTSGTTLTVATHNNNPVAVIYNGHSANTSLLTVSAPAITATNFEQLQAAIDDFNTSATADTTILIGADFDIEEALIITNSNYTLTISSDTITRTIKRGYNGTSETGSLFSVNSSAKLVFDNIVIDGDKENDKYINNRESLVSIGTGSLFTMKPGAALQNNSSFYGCVLVNGGEFTMDGGRISENHTSNEGGGVFVYNGGSFNMNGGEILGNSARRGGGVSIGNGIGVFSSTCAFIMNGGKISGNTANTSGGGIYNTGTFTMNDGEISDNTANTSGGGVSVEYTGVLFAMNGGEISGNTANTSGGGVYISLSQNKFFMTGGSIIGNTATICSGVFIGGYSETSLLVSETAVVGTGSDGNTIAGSPLYPWRVVVTIGETGLSEDAFINIEPHSTDRPGTIIATKQGGDPVTLGEVGVFNYLGDYFTCVADGENVMLAVTAEVPSIVTNFPQLVAAIEDFNNNATSDTTIFIGADFNIEVNLFITNIYHTLTITSYDTTRTLTRCFSAGIGGINGLFSVSQYEASLVLEDLIIDGNKDNNKINEAPLVAVVGVFTMNQGAVLRNNAALIDCGGVNISASGTFNMNGGEISGNIAETGGGVYNRGIFKMNGGEISGNTAETGGGIYTVRGIIISGGKISDNTASIGSGIYNGNNSYPIEVSGTAVIGTATDGNAITRAQVTMAIRLIESGLSPGAFVNIDPHADDSDCTIIATKQNGDPVSPAELVAFHYLGSGFICVADGANVVLKESESFAPGDVNKDGKVDATDLSMLISDFGKSGTDITNSGSDVNGDGKVDATDLSMLIANFGKETNNSPPWGGAQRRGG